MSAAPQQFTLNSLDGTTLACKIWQPADYPKAVIILVHGIGEYSGRYHHVADYFQQRGFVVFTLDLRGHGRSKGRRGHVKHFDEYRQDVLQLVQHAHQQTPEIPAFLIGHSMGGLVSLLFALAHPDEINAVIASGPAFVPIIPVPVWKVTLGQLLANVLPSFSMDNEIMPDMVSRNPEIVQAYGSDPLVHARVSARWFSEFNSARTWVMDNANTLSVPALLLHGKADKLVDPAGTEEFFNRIGLDDKHLILYDELYHEIFNEPEQVTVFSDIEAWILPRLQPHIVQD